MIDRGRKIKLLRLARETISSHFENREPESFKLLMDDRELSVNNGVFVTLKKGEEEALRGCIGTIVANVPIPESVRSNSIQSAFHDPRFQPLQKSELEDVEIEISILSLPHEMSSWRDIKIGRDGIIIRKSFQAAVFLPQVAPEQGWDLETTLTHLSLKAGLNPDEWRKPGCTFSTFTAEYFSENEFSELGGR